MIKKGFQVGSGIESRKRRARCRREVLHLVWGLSHLRPSYLELHNICPKTSWFKTAAWIMVTDL